MTRPRLYLDLVFALLILAVLTFLIRWLDWDLRFSAQFFSPEKGWYLGDAQPWASFYEFGTWPAILFAVGAIVLFVAGYRSARFRRWRKICVFFVLALILGPGLVVNAAFKDNWGRPRPRQVEQFGGKEKFEPVLHFDSASDGKSFPCGHCSMGFYFLALYLVLRRVRSRWWLPVLLATLLFGAGIGMARIVQGGHFLSDVVWSGGMSFVAFFVLFLALGMHREPFYFPRDSSGPVEGRIPRWVIVLASVVLGIGLAVFSVATPYHGRFLHRGSQDLIHAADRLEIVLRLEVESATLRFGPALALEGEADGFGVPGSAIKERWRESLAGNGEYSAELKQRISGFFSELDSELAIEVPVRPNAYVKVAGSDTALNVDLRGLPSHASVRIQGVPPGSVMPFGFIEEAPGVFRRGEGGVSMKLILEMGDEPVAFTNGDEE